MGMTDKQTFRKEARTARNAMSETERKTVDGKIADRVVALSEFTQAKALFTYLSVDSEVDTRAIITAALGSGKLVALPRVVPGTREMTWHAVTSLDGMERSSFGIEEPPASFTQIDPTTCAKTQQSLALVPGFAFDKKGNRIGYGGGFYDAFLAKFPGETIGLCRACSLVDDLNDLIPIEPHDLPVARVITEH